MKKNLINDFLGELKQARLNGRREISKTQEEAEALMGKCDFVSPMFPELQALAFGYIDTIQGVKITIR